MAVGAIFQKNHFTRLEEIAGGLTFRQGGPPKES
jgi:hypothetical protein